MQEWQFKLYRWKCEQILDKTRENLNFDPAFVEDMRERLEKNGFLTLSQQQALDNIHHGFVSSGGCR